MSAERDAAKRQEYEIAEGCLDCPHPDYCAGMGQCEIGAAKLADRSVACKGDVPEPYDESEVDERGTPFMLASRPPTPSDHAATKRLTFAQTVNEIRDLLSKLSNAPHEEHFGPLCPICGLVTSLQRTLEAWRDD